MYSSYTWWNVGLLYRYQRLHCQGTSAQTVTPKPEVSFVHLEMWSHSEWNAGSHLVTPLPAGSCWPEGFLGAGVGASLFGASRVFCVMLSSNRVFPCALVQVSLHQPGGTLGNPGLCHTVWIGHLLHLQRLWPMDSQPGVSTRPGMTPHLGGRWWEGIFPLLHNNQTKAAQEIVKWWNPVSGWDYSSWSCKSLSTW